MRLRNQNGSTAFRIRLQDGDEAGSLGWMGRGWTFYLRGSGLSCSRRLGAPDDNFIFQGALNWETSDIFQVNISFSYFLSKIKLVRQVAGDLPQMESSCTSVLRCYLIQINAHQ